MKEQRDTHPEKGKEESYKIEQNVIGSYYHPTQGLGN